MSADAATRQEVADIAPMVNAGIASTDESEGENFVRDIEVSNRRITSMTKEDTSDGVTVDLTYEVTLKNTGPLPFGSVQLSNVVLEIAMGTVPDIVLIDGQSKTARFIRRGQEKAVKFTATVEGGEELDGGTIPPCLIGQMTYESRMDVAAPTSEASALFSKSFSSSGMMDADNSGC